MTESDQKPALSGATRYSKNKPVQGLRDLDLTRQPRILADAFGAFEERLFHIVLRTYDILPLFIDVDVTSGAGAGSATLCLYTGNVAPDGTFHHGKSGIDTNFVFNIVWVDIRDNGHSSQCEIRRKSSARRHDPVCQLTGAPTYFPKGVKLNR